MGYTRLSLPVIPGRSQWYLFLTFLTSAGGILAIQIPDILTPKYPLSVVLLYLEKHISREEYLRIP